jgi:hypothetical protein
MKNIFIISMLISANLGYAQVWSTLNDLTLSNHHVNRLQVINDTLYVAGYYQYVNDLTSSGIFTWDSTQVNLISNTPEIFIDDFLLYNNELFVVGNFTQIEDIVGTHGLASLTNGSWQSVGGGGGTVVDNPDCCVRWDDKIYIGNGFNEIGDISVPYGFASWDGTSWFAEESVFGFGEGPKKMTIYNGEIVGGGDFNQTTTGELAHKVARFDGTYWHDIAGGVNGTVYSLFVDGNNLYVGGTCTEAQYGDLVVPNNIAFYDGNQWNAIGEFEEIGNTIHAIAIYRGQIYVGGVITLNGIPLKTLAYFDGVHWNAVPGSEDMNERVSCLQVYKDELYIGGRFDIAGGLEVPGIVRYYLHPDSVQWGVPDHVIEHEKLDFTVYPNPASDELTVEFDENVTGELLLTDISGKEIFRESIGNRKRVQIPLSTFPRGMIVVSVIRGGRFVASKKVVLE